MKNKEALCYIQKRLRLLFATWRSSSIRLENAIAAWRAHSQVKLHCKSDSWQCPSLGSAPGAMDEVVVAL